MKLIKKPEEIEFSIMGMDSVIVLKYGEIVEVKFNEVQTEGGMDEVITLKDISDQFHNDCLLVLWERPLEGAVYRYNNYGNKEWYQVGTLAGYA